MVKKRRNVSVIRDGDVVEDVDVQRKTMIIRILIILRLCVSEIIILRFRFLKKMNVMRGTKL